MTPINQKNQSTSKKQQMSHIEEKAVPDSTTTQAEKQLQEFTKGHDVLAKQKDGRYYLGTIVQVDAAQEQCLVKYGDNTQHWSSFRDLTKLSSGLEQEDLLCVICKKSAPKNDKVISVCDRCGRGYHRKCHQPEIPSQKEETSWMCKRCIESDPNRLKKIDSKPPFRRDSRNSTGSLTQDILPTSTSPKVLSYELSSLNWDTYHRVNTEQIYCYCGGNGEWYKQMLQCGRCKQWFHEKCMDCLQFPLYCGDRFYVFVCAMCNHGKEFVRRLEMKWVDLVHLMLFNLTVHHCKKYYDLDTVVIPYISDNWHALHLSPKMANVTKAERRDHILSVLTNNRNRFKCGREIKKRTTIWGLRIRLPPPAPCVVLPQPNRKVTELELRELWQGNRRLQFLSPPANTNGRKIVSCDGAMRSLMVGTAYKHSDNHSETESPCPSPDFEKEERVILQPPIITKYPLSKAEYLGAGCAKKTAPFKKMSLQRRKKLLAMTNRERDRILKRPRRLVTTKKGENENATSGTKQSNKVADSKLSNCDGRSKGVELPPTPPTSVSAPPTPPASTGGGSMQSDFSNDFSECSNQVKTVPLKKQNLTDIELNTPCDTSSDETSSKSTLDLIIPPPKDFEGKNNPFLALLRGSSVDDQNCKKKKGKDITLPLPLKTVIPGQPVMRPMKRQLSEKDIIVGPNGEIKRKKRLRRNRNNMVNYGVSQTASKTATVLPARPSDTNSQIGTCMDYTLNTHTRRLRQRPEKPPEKEIPPASVPPKQPTPKPSPVKTEPDIDMEDLKTSVNMYFGAANRIATGERFAVRAKRVGPTGKVECLIEWEGPGEAQGMT